MSKCCIVASALVTRPSEELANNVKAEIQEEDPQEESAKAAITENSKSIE